MISESEKLAEFAAAVRDSTIKRLKQVPSEKENWEITPEVMSFTEIAYHLKKFLINDLEKKLQSGG